jgi:hypothetical protein
MQIYYLQWPLIVFCDPARISKQRWSQHYHFGDDFMGALWN